MKLWTWQLPSFDITTSSHNLDKVVDGWGEDTSRVLLPIYAKLHDVLETQDFVFCFSKYVHWGQIEVRRLWILEVDENHILGYLNSDVWNSIVDDAFNGEWDRILVHRTDAIESIRAGRDDITPLVKIPIAPDAVVDKSRFNKPLRTDVRYDELPSTIEESAKSCVALGCDEGLVFDD